MLPLPGVINWVTWDRGAELALILDVEALAFFLLLLLFSFFLCSKFVFEEDV